MIEYIIDIKRRHTLKSKAGKFLILFSFIMVSYGFVLSLEQAILYDMQELYGANSEIMGFAVAAKSTAQFIIPILIGFLADRFGKKKFLLIFTAAAILGCLVIGFSNTLLIYVAGSLLLGAACSTIESMVVSLLPDIDAEHNTQNGNFIQVIYAIGAGTSPLLVATLIDKGIMSWRAGFWMFAVVYAGIFIASAIIKFPKSRLAEANESASKEDKITVRKVLTVLFIVLFSLMMIYLIIENSFAFFIDSLSVQKGNETAGAWALSCFWYGMGISRFWVSKQKEPDEIKVVRVSFILSGITVALVLVCKSALLSIILCLAAGISFGPIWPTIVGYAGKKYSGSASLVSLIVAGGALGGIIGPAMTGAISERVSMMLAFAILALFAFAGAAITLLLKKRNAEEKKTEENK